MAHLSALSAALVCVLSLACGVAAASADKSSAPVLFWSPLPVFSGHEVSQQIQSGANVRQFVSDMMMVQKPEVVVAFVYPSFPKDRTTLSQVKSVMAESKYSLTYPFVKMSEPLLAGVQSQAFSIVSEEDCESMMAKLKEGKVFDNAASDLVIVNLPLDAKADELVAFANDLIAKASHARYVALLTADSATAVHYELTALHPQLLAVAPVWLSALSDNSSNGTIPVPSNSSNGTIPVTVTGGVQKISSDMVFTIMLVACLLYTLAVGVCCVANIETPVRFAQQPMQLAKEY